MFISLFIIQALKTETTPPPENTPVVSKDTAVAGGASDPNAAPASGDKQVKTTGQLIATEGVEPPKCNQKLIVALGLEGYHKPKAQQLEMCKTLKDSCCRHADQLTIYTNWVKNNEEESLAQTLKEQAFVFDSFIDLSTQVFERAKAMNELVKNKKKSNCRILTDKILKHEIDKIGASIKSATKTMHDFFKESYKGFYCAVCDGATQRFIDTRGRKFDYSEKFCRSIVVNSLNFLNYYHIHFNKYANLQARFLTSCNNKGKYKDKPIKNAPSFSYNEIVYNKLYACKKYRNTEDWMDHCGDICTAFQVTKYNDFFSPNVNKFNRFNRFVARNLLRYKRLAEKEAKKAEAKAAADEKKDKPADAANAPKTDAAPAPASKRKLADAAPAPATPAPAPATPAPAPGTPAPAPGTPAPAPGTPAPAGAPAAGPAAEAKAEVVTLTVEELENLLVEIYRFERNPPIIRASIGTDMDIEHFTSRFKEEGIDLYNYGTNTDISEGALKNINHEAELEDERVASLAITRAGLAAANSVNIMMGLWTSLFVFAVALLNK